MNASGQVCITAATLIIAVTLYARQSSQEDFEKLRRQQQQRQQQELRRSQDETLTAAERMQRMIDGANASLGDLVASTSALRTEGCVAQAMFADPSVDLQSMPLAAWIAGGEKEEISWKVDFGKPVLRMDQRYELAYSGSIELKNLEWAGDSEELVYITGISGLDGQWIIPPKAGRQIFESRKAAEPRILFGDCVFLQPGDYNLIVVATDTHSGERSLAQHRIRRSDFSEEPLPELTSSLPSALFPDPAETDPQTPEPLPAPLVLPVANKRPVAIELISVLTTPDEWSQRPDFIRRTNNRLLATMWVLSQMRLANSSKSAVALDLINRTKIFEQETVVDLDWKRLEAALPKPSDIAKVDVRALEHRKERGVFFRDFLKKRLEDAGGAFRVVILVGGSARFESGSDLAPLVLKGTCRCRVYHLHLQIRDNDVVDDLEKLLKRLRPQTFDILSGEDLQRALAEIVHDLESL
jgi:hypothetical protein